MDDALERSDSNARETGRRKSMKKDRKRGTSETVPAGNGKTSSGDVTEALAGEQAPTLDRQSDSNKLSKILLTSDCAPKPESIIFQTTGILPSMKNASGQIVLTNDFLIFQSKQLRPAGCLRVKWTDVTGCNDQKTTEKAITLDIDSESLVFTSVKDRQGLTLFIKIILSTTKSKVKSYGFVRKDDEEVATKINIFRGSHVFEDVIPTSFQDVIQALREDSTIYNMLTVVGCVDVNISEWTKTKKGIQRRVQFTHPVGKNCYVSAVFTLMKSGNACALEGNYTYSRASIGTFLQSNAQFYFRANDEVVDFRGSYNIDRLSDTWDKEFVDGAVSRMNRMNFYYLKSRFSNEAFDIAKYEGKWRMHQPYVLVISALAVLLLLVIVFPVDTNWYKIIAGICVVGVFFYM